MYAGGEEWIGQRLVSADQDARGARDRSSATFGSRSCRPRRVLRHLRLFASRLSWKFGLGFVLLILVHEIGPLRSRRERQGLQRVAADVRSVPRRVRARSGTRGLAPWRNALISLAGPFVGGIGAAVVLGGGSNRGPARGSSISRTSASCSTPPTSCRSASSTAARSSAGSRQTWQRPAIRYENGVPVEASRAGAQPRRADRVRSTVSSRSRSCSARSRRGIVGRSDAARSRPSPDAPVARVPEGAERDDRRRVLHRLRGGGEDRPAGGLVLRLGADAGGDRAPTSSRARSGGCSRRRAGRS